MIIFYGNGFELDMTLFGITLNEENNMFIDNLIKSYSFPFRIPLSDSMVKNLGFPNIEAISDSSSSIRGKLVVDNVYYSATLKTGDRQGDEIEAELYYGDEELPVYGTKLGHLPWPINIVTTTYALAEKHLQASWPVVTHNFPAIFKPTLKEKDDYSDFQYFANNYNGNDFVSNLINIVGSDTYFLNRNVLMPCPYLLEMVSFGYRTGGKKVRGSLFEDDRIKKLVLLPERFLEKFKGSTYDYWQFSLPDTTETNTLGTIGVYSRTMSPSSTGTYNVKINLDLDPVIAKYFSLRIYRKHTVTQVTTDEFTASSLNNRVTINKEISINVEGDQVNESIIVELRLLYTTQSISEKNSFEYSYKEGRLNELDTSYSLAEMMPDMTFGDFIDSIKNWLNLDITMDEEFVTIDFIDKALDKLEIVDNGHLEEQYPKIKSNTDRLFKLNYPNGDKLFIDRSGVIYSDLDRDESDAITIKMNCHMGTVEYNHGRTTVVDPEEASYLTFALYDGLDASNRNNSVDNVNGFTGKIENIYQEFWKNWIYRRSINKTIKDRFSIHHTEPLKVLSKIFKYNQILLPVKIRKKRVGNEYYDVEMEAETI